MPLYVALRMEVLIEILSLFANCQGTTRFLTVYTSGNSSPVLTILRVETYFLIEE